MQTASSSEQPSADQAFMVTSMKSTKKRKSKIDWERVRGGKDHRGRMQKGHKDWIDIGSVTAREKGYARDWQRWEWRER